MFFELVIEKEDGSRRDGEEDEQFGRNADGLEGLTPEEFYDMKVFVRLGFQYFVLY